MHFPHFLCLYIATKCSWMCQCNYFFFFPTSLLRSQFTNGKSAISLALMNLWINSIWYVAKWVKQTTRHSTSFRTHKLTHNRFLKTIRCKKKIVFFNWFHFSVGDYQIMSSDNGCRVGFFFFFGFRIGNGIPFNWIIRRKKSKFVTCGSNVSFNQTSSLLFCCILFCFWSQLIVTIYICVEWLTRWQHNIKEFENEWMFNNTKGKNEQNAWSLKKKIQKIEKS